MLDIWNYLTVSKLFVLDEYSWYHTMFSYVLLYMPVLANQKMLNSALCII